MNEQGELLPVDHRGLQPRRLRKAPRNSWYVSVNAERIYAAEWLRLCRDRLSSGHSYLEHILAVDCDPDKSPRVSRRDAAVAASVIQWLATNCGLGFIRNCERKVEEAEREEYERRARPSLLKLERDARQAGQHAAGRRLERAMELR